MKCDATWAPPRGEDACGGERAVWGPLDPSLEFMASGLSGLVTICESHQSSLDGWQRLEPSQVGQGSTLWPLYRGSSPVSHSSPGMEAVSRFVFDVNAARLRYLDGWEVEAKALIDEYGVEAVEEHLAVVRSGVASTTMLADVPVGEQLMVAKMIIDAIEIRRSPITTL